MRNIIAGIAAAALGFVAASCATLSDMIAPLEAPNPAPCASNPLCRSALLLYSGGEGICGAVAVSPAQIVTAAHCVDGAGDPLLTLIAHDGSVIAARVTVDNDATDIALLEAVGAPHPLDFVPELAPGTIGHATLIRPIRNWSSTPALISGSDAGNLIAGAGLDFGDSGSPVFDAEGRLVGVISTCVGFLGTCSNLGGAYAPVM